MSVLYLVLVLLFSLQSSFLYKIISVILTSYYYFYSLRLKSKEVASLLGVSESTTERGIFEYEAFARQRYSNIDEEALDSVVEGRINERISKLWLQEVDRSLSSCCAPNSTKPHEGVHEKG